MQKFSHVGEVRKDHHALALNVQGWELGRLVVAAGDVPALLNGAEVEVSFIQERDDGEVFVGHAGRARPSRSGRAVTLWIEGQIYTSPIAQVRQVVAGTRQAALVSRPADSPIIDADQEQRKAIDHDLIWSFT